MKRQKKTGFQKFILAAGCMIMVFFFTLCMAQENNQEYTEKFRGRVISEIAIQISGIHGDSGTFEAMARDLIPFKEQDTYSFKKMEQAIARLVEANLFQSVHAADPEQTPQGVRLSFFLVPFGRIKDIVIENAFPLFHKEVLNAMNIYTGDAFSEELLNDQAQRVAGLFRAQGYAAPQIKVSAQKDASDGNYTIWVRIEKGGFYRVDKINFKGNRHVSAATLKLRISSWKSLVPFANARRLIQKALDENIKNFISYYRQKGFADVRVEAELLKDEIEKKVDVVFHIQEGPRYDISFQGNKHFLAFTLKKQIAPLFKDGNRNNFGLRKSIRNLKQLYTESGYLDAVIEKQITDNAPENPSLRKVALKIDEGYPYRVTRLAISGNHAVSGKEILNSMLTRVKAINSSGSYVPDVLEEDIQAVAALYHGQGFTQTRVEKKIQITQEASSGEAGQNAVEITLMIDEGVQTRVAGISFENLTVVPQETALSMMTMKPGMAYNDALIEIDEKNLQQKISEKGYPHAAVKGVTKFVQDRSQAFLSYRVDEGPKVTIGQVFYAGNFRTRKKILDNEMEITTGEPLKLSKLLESRRNVSDINALDSARLRTIGFKAADKEVDVLVEVAEKKPYLFEIGTGYDTERHLYLNTLIGDRNFTGGNLDLKSEAEISQIGYKANVSLTDPRVFSTRVASTTRVFTEDREEFNKDFGIVTYGASQDFSQSFFDKKLMAGLGFVYEYREQYLTLDRQLTDTEQEQYTPRNILVTSPGLTYKTTDSYVRPRKGIFSSINLDISKGIENDLDDFIKYRLDTRYYYTPFEPLTLAVRGRYGFIQPYGSNTHVPEDQLFYLGGTSTVRGFDENMLRVDANGQAVGGRQVILGSLETRYDLGMNIELTAFYDIGSVTETQDRDTLESFRDSVGIGLRYMTPIGPIGFLYGRKLDPKPNESPGSFHFSMGYTF